MRIITILLLTAIGVAAQQTSSQQLAAFLSHFGSSDTRQLDSDLSADSFARQLAGTKAQLAQLRAIDRSKLSIDESIDLRFAESILTGQELSQEKMLHWRKDPRVYMQFRRIGMTIARPGAAEEKARIVLRALDMIPGQLANGKKNLDVYIPRFQELSVFMADGAGSIFEKDVPEFAAQVPAQKDAILKANANALAALKSYTDYLKAGYTKLPKGDFAIGRSTYDAMLKGQYLLDYNADTLYKFGWDQFNSTVKELEAVAHAIDPKKTWQQLAVAIKNEYPDPLKEIEVHQEWVNKSRDHIKSKGLIPIPWNERVDVVPRAEYLRKTSYYGNFSGARGPNKDGVWVGQWQINPFDPSWDEKTKQDYLVEHDWGVIVDTAPHETYGGHHVQGLYQQHNPDPLRKNNGISIFSEGWGLYNEKLMQETGFFPNEKIHLRMLQLRLWRIARVIWDVGIHTDKMTYEGAVSLLSDRVGFLRWAAQLEVDGSAENPGYRLGYFMGYSEIMKMREEFKAKMGSKFTLSDFHERLLKVGNMPPALMREGLMASLKN